MGSCDGRRRNVLARAALTSAAAVLCAAAVAACGTDADGDDAEPATWQSVYGERYGTGPDDVVVEMRADGYHPETVHVTAGGRITWINVGTARATAENFGQPLPRFDTHTIHRGQVKSVRFERPGRERYVSSYDSTTFAGTIIVEPAREGTGGP